LVFSTVRNLSFPNNLEISEPSINIGEFLKVIESFSFIEYSLITFSVSKSSIENFNLILELAI